MDRWPFRLLLGCSLLAAGCVPRGILRWDRSPGAVTSSQSGRPDVALHPAAHEAGERDAKPIAATGSGLPTGPASEAAPAGQVLPLEQCIHQALETNPTVRAARFNVESLRQRIPQVTALDDPILSNTIFPIPSVAPQYSLMGYMPYGALLAQQFPWCGTLRLRGQAAEQDVQVALQELAATELDVVSTVKRVYHDLHYAERTLELLRQNRGLAVDFVRIARERYRLSTAGQADVLRAEVAVSDVDRELENGRRAQDEARNELGRLLRLETTTGLRTAPDLSPGDVPAELERLAQLAVAARPELRGRLAAIARDQKAIELARKRYYPNLTVGLVYQQMEKTNAETPLTAGGMPNVGLFLGMNLPIYHKKLAAGVCEAQARAAADAQLYEAEKDQVRRDIKDAFVQAKSQASVLGLLRRSNLPTARRILELTAADYRAGRNGVDYLSLVAAWREVLQVELQVAQLEAELGKSLASLERAVGTQLNEHPPGPGPPETPAGAAAPVPAAPTSSASPFRPERPR